MAALLLPRARCLDLLVMTPSTAMGIGKLKQIHAQMIVGGSLRRPNAVGKLIERYAAVSAPEGIDHARLVFRYHAGKADVFAWNVVIRRSPPRESILLYAQHCDQKGGSGFAFVPDDRTFTFVISACARSAALREGMQVHAQILKTRPPGSLDVAVLTTGVHFYGNLGDVKSARRLFDEMPTRNCATWNALMAGYCLNCVAAEAAALFKEMLREEGYMRPTDRSMVVMLSACSQLGQLALGSSVHAYIRKAIPFEDDTFVGTGLVDMYSKCGCLGSAQKAFEGTNEKNVLTWTAVTAGLAFHSRGEAAIKMLDAMLGEGISPNAVTFTSLLSACCHAGLIDEGLELFEMMSSRFGITPSIQHYGCVVDLLGRVGMVDEARSFVRSMPVAPDAVLWRTLLAACKAHGRVSMGEEIGEKLLQLEQGSGESRGGATTCEDYVALSNMYASDGRWEDVWRVREMMKGMGLENRSGSSSVPVQLSNQKHQFEG